MSEIPTPVPSYWFEMHHGTGVAVRTLLNDLPIYTGMGQKSITVSAPANHLLVPGNNVLALEVFPAPHPASAPTIEGPAVFTLRVDDAGSEIVHRARWPECWDELPVEQRVLPFVHVTRFAVDERLPRPVYWDALPTDFDLAGTPEQHEAVREVYRAFTLRDTNAFFAANELKLAERQRAYPDNGDFDPELQRSKLEGALAREWQVRPTNLADLTFESRAGGRVAYVTRRDGGRALEAVAADDPSETFAADLFLTRREGRWRVFR